MKHKNQIHIKLHTKFTGEKITQKRMKNKIVQSNIKFLLKLIRLER